MDRRGFLGTCLAGALAGCNLASGDDESTQPRLGSVTVVNNTGEPQTAELRVRLEEETVHREAYRVEASDPATTGAGKTAIEPAWPDARGRWLVDGRLTGGSTDRWATVALSAVEPRGPCISLILRIQKGARLNWSSNNTCPSLDGE